MAKLRETPLTAEDLDRYITTTNDFGFELQIRRQLTGKCVSLLHSGTYIDSVTKKSRQFDLRAQIRNPGHGFLNGDFLLPIECKNIGAFHPLLISCVPRREDECFHEVVAYHQEITQIIRIPRSRSIYRVGENVGKSCAHVGIPATGVGFQDSDREFHDQWAQALSSAVDLVQVAGVLVTEGKTQAAMILPIVVVPNGCLWEVDYDDAGKLVRGPYPTERVSLFVAHNIPAKTLSRTYHVSHVEFLTSDGLENLRKSISEPGRVEFFFNFDY